MLKEVLAPGDGPLPFPIPLSMVIRLVQGPGLDHSREKKRKKPRKQKPVVAGRLSR